MRAYDKVLAAAENDNTIFTERGKETETFGHNPQMLLDLHGITKSDLIRLERKGLALKARYITRNKTGKSYFKGPDNLSVPVDGPHRVRWILFRAEAA